MIPDEKPDGFEMSFGTNKDSVGLWFSPAVIQPNNFVYKSLSCWSFNIAVGCSHGCQFCYVPSAATIKQGHNLARYGVNNPDLDWGKYVLLRPWDEKRFLASLRAAERTPRSELNRDGNRAVMYCTTTDPYQVIHHADPERRKDLATKARNLVRRSLELIRDESTLNVRILTRSPMARLDFDLYRTFGKRLVFGMSLPSLRNDLAKIYEPRAPAPTQRLATLKIAKEEKLYVYVAMAPTYPECDEGDLRSTLRAIKELEPITIFHEPINLRADNALKIAEIAQRSGMKMRSEVFENRDAWRSYAISSLETVWRIAKEMRLEKKLHLWPDKSLGSSASLRAIPNATSFEEWLKARWSRVSEWPGKR